MYGGVKGQFPIGDHLGLGCRFLHGSFSVRSSHTAWRISKSLRLHAYCVFGSPWGPSASTPLPALRLPF